MKKFFSLVLALVMALSLTTVAWGAGNTITVGASGDKATLAEAIDVAVDGDTIQLLENVTLTSRVTVSEELILDLGAFTITAAINDTYGAVYVGMAGNLTINATTGGITNTAGHAIGNYGVVTINGGTFTGDYALYNFYHNTTTFGTATINGGTFQASSGTLAVANCGDLTVAGGSVESLDSSAVLDVTGGTIEELAVTEPDYAPPVTETTISDGTVESLTVEAVVEDSIAISGGTFNTDVSEYVAAGKNLVSNGAGGYVVAAETSGSTTTNTVKKDGYSLISMDNTISQVVTADFTKTVISPKTVTSGNVTTTTYYADRYVINGTVCWACDASIAEAKLVKSGIVVAYLTTDTAVGAGVTKNASAFVAAKENPACGEYDVNTYVVGGKNYVVGSAEYVLYNGLVVGIGGEATAEPHDFSKKNITTDTKGAIVSIKCDNCKKSFTVVPVGKVPATYAGAVDTTTLAANGNVILMGTATVVTPSTDKTVTSAETFDAGIAMYVGMSVLAAAGSVVVLKKRED